MESKRWDVLMAFRWKKAFVLTQKPFCFLKQKHYCWKHCLLYFALTFFLSLEVGKSFFSHFISVSPLLSLKVTAARHSRKLSVFIFQWKYFFSASLLDPKRKSEFLVGDVSVSEVFGSLNRFDRGRNRKKKKSVFRRASEFRESARTAESPTSERKKTREEKSRRNRSVGPKRIPRNFADPRL